MTPSAPHHGGPGASSGPSSYSRQPQSSHYGATPSRPGPSAATPSRPAPHSGHYSGHSGSPSHPAPQSAHHGGYASSGSLGNSRPEPGSSHGAVRPVDRGGQTGIGREGQPGSHSAGTSRSNPHVSGGPVARPYGHDGREVGHGPGGPGHGGHGFGPGHGPGGSHHVGPEHRDFIDRGHASRYYHGGPHYFGYRVRALPPGYSRYRYYGRDYFFLDGIYYRFWDGFYHICRPPFGIVTAAIDAALMSLVRFSYYNTYYRTYDSIADNYATIDAQNRTIAQNNAIIAAQNSAVAQAAQTANDAASLAASLGLIQSYAGANTQYYYQDGVFYIVNASGQYITIIPPAGALIENLPDDYKVITLKGDTYFQVDNTVYRTVVVDGAPLFEVLGQFPS